MTDTSMLAAALGYARRDVRVLPLYEIRNGRCACGKADCISPGKHPRNSNGATGATMDEAQIRAWWAKWPAANIGTATGDRFWVMDVDPRHGGNESVMQLLQQHGSMPETVMVNTGSGGRIIVLRGELEAFLAGLPGVTAAEAAENATARRP